MKKILIRLISMLLCIIMTIYCTTTCFAINQQKTLNVAFYQLDGFFEFDAAGNRIGYGIDLLNKISEYSGIKFNYIDAKTWEETGDMLATGKADIRLPVTLPNSAKPKFAYTSEDIMNTFHAIMTLENKEDLYYNDIDKIKTLKIAIVKSMYDDVEVKSYLNKVGIKKKNLIFYTEYSLCKRAIKQNKADALISNVMDLTKNMKILARINTISNYISMVKNNPYLEVLNNALYKINIDDPSFITSLSQKWYSERTNTPFTKEEVTYINQKKQITIGNLPNRYPFSNYNESTRNLSGINEDVLNWISDYSGLKFKLQPIDITEKPISALKSNKFDLVAGILLNSRILSDNNLIISNSFITSSISVIKRQEYSYSASKKQTVVVKKSFQGIQNYISANYPQYTIIYRDTDEECLDALVSNDADIIFQNIYVMNYLLQKSKYSSLEMLPTSSFIEQDCIASLNNNDNATLISIINKSIEAMSEDKLNSIIVANTTAQPYKMTWEDIYYKYRIPLLIIIILIIDLNALLVLIILLRQRNAKKLEAKNVQLQAAYNEAQVASNAKSDFLARMSHDIRTPMNAIIGITTIAKDHLNEPVVVEEDLDKIKLSSNILLSLLNDVLDMSAIESGKIRISNTPFDFKQLISSITTIYYSECKQKNIEFEVNIKSPLPEKLVGDQLRLNQILMNLISNAVKFTDKGKVTFLIEETQRKENKVYLKFTVSDTGCGISEDMRKRIFKPFEQETSVTAQEHGGSGLGLAIVKNLVMLMNGAIDLHSEKEQGTTFIVEIPFTLCNDNNNTQTIAYDIVNILVVDDEKDARIYASAVLDRIGVKYKCVSNGKEALEELKHATEIKKPYNICLIDWQMPQMNGLDVAKQIRELYNKDTVIIIASAYDYSEIETTDSSHYADKFISKPLFQSSLFDLLMSITNGKLVKNREPNDKYDFNHQKILLVEDNEINRFVATELLKKGNFICETANCGEEAVEKFMSCEKGTYVAILMDIQMPGMNGYETAKVIRHSNHPEATSIPIIAMTANSLSEDVSIALSCGMNGHVSKPIEVDVLFSTIKSVINKRRK